MTLESTKPTDNVPLFSPASVSGMKPLGSTKPGCLTPRRLRKDMVDLTLTSHPTGHGLVHTNRRNDCNPSVNNVLQSQVPPSLFRSNNRGDDGDDEYDDDDIHDNEDGKVDDDDECDDDDDDDVHMNTPLHATAESVAKNETPLSGSSLCYPQRVKRIASAVRTILDCLDDEPRRAGLRKTPERYAKALLSLTEGYSQTLEQVVKDAKFSETPSESVMVRNIDVFSMCEHHLLPFHGVCHVSYLPNSHVIGLSKVARIVNMYARRMQVQERLTAQIADAVQQATNAHGVMVLMSCAHMCMSMRGVEKVTAQTSTTVTRGRYTTDKSLRSEFLATIACT